MSSFPLGTDVYVLSNNSEHAAKIVGPVTGPTTNPATGQASSLQTIRVKWTVRGGEDDVDIERVNRMWDEVRRPGTMRLCVCVCVCVCVCACACVESVNRNEAGVCATFAGDGGFSRRLLETLVLLSTFYS